MYYGLDWFTHGQAIRYVLYDENGTRIDEEIRFDSSVDKMAKHFGQMYACGIVNWTTGEVIYRLEEK